MAALQCLLFSKSHQKRIVYMSSPIQSTAPKVKNTLVTVGGQGFLLSQCSFFPIQPACCKKRQQWCQSKPATLGLGLGELSDKSTIMAHLHWFTRVLRLFHSSLVHSSAFPQVRLDGHMRGTSSGFLDYLTPSVSLHTTLRVCVCLSGFQIPHVDGKSVFQIRPSMVHRMHGLMEGCSYTIVCLCIYL